MSLDDLRKQIDSIDREILQRINQRVTLAGEIGRIKHAAGAEVYVPSREEEVFTPGSSLPLDLKADSEANLLLQRVRDEAHRFAITHHRGRRDRAMTASVLDGIRGVGPNRKRLLIRHFGSPDRLLEASREEIEAVPGLPGKVAREIHDQLNRIG